MFPENRKNIITHKARQIHQQPAIFVEDFKIELKYVNICWTLSDTINTATFSIENNIYRLFVSARLFIQDFTYLRMHFSDFLL